MTKGPGNGDNGAPTKVPIEDELDLHTFLPKEVPSLLEEYLNACQQASIYSVRIIHGKGKGFLKDRVRGLLKKLPVVASFSEASGSEGGWGATIVELKRQDDPLSPMWADFLVQVDQGARAMGIDLEPSQINLFAVHAKELLEWNRFANLTAITDPKEMAEKHFVDTVPLVPLIPKNALVLDIGSGGGFPGIPLKILRPDLKMCLIDASRKKTNFLKHVIRTLGLKDIEARHIRAEDLVKDLHATADYYSVIVSKAASKLDTLLDQALPLLRSPGMVIAMKAASVEDELKEAKPRITSEALILEERAYHLPLLGIERTLIILRKKV